MAWRGYQGQGAGQWPPQKPQGVGCGGWGQQPPMSAMTVAPPSQAQHMGGHAAAQTQGFGGALAVFTKGDDGQEIVIRTLVGDYFEHSTNHGRKVYMKKLERERTPDTVDVYMYYWDGRDGPAFEGWWLGSQVGGTQVWSHNPNSTLQPPPTGWKIPWDCAVRQTLCVGSKAEYAQQDAQEQMRTTQKLTNDASAAARAALQRVKAAIAAAGGEGTHANAQDVPPAVISELQQSEQALTAVLPLLADAARRIQDAQKPGSTDPPAVKQQLAQFANSVRLLQQSTNQEVQKVRDVRQRCENDAKEKEAKDRDMLQFQELFAEATEKTNMAEDAVEKALITAGLITGAGDDLEEAKLAVAQVEQASAEAQKFIQEARANVNMKMAQSRRLQTESGKQHANDELAKLQAQIQEAQDKLNPLKSVREDFQQRQMAQRVANEILTKLTTAELDVDRAEEATMLLAAADNVKDHLPRAEQAAKKATDHLASVLNLIKQRQKLAKGPVMTELQSLEERLKTSQDRLVELKNAHKEAKERGTLEALLEEAEEKVKAVAQSIGKVQDAEGPFLMGIDELPLDDTLRIVGECETEAATSHSLASAARMFIATKLVEVKRFTDGPSKECMGKLKEFQTLLEGHTKKLAELKASTATRKRGTVVRQAERESEQAFALVRKVEEAAAALDDDEKLAAMSAIELRKSVEAVGRAEALAQPAIKKAREFITARQLEAKAARDSSAEVSTSLIRLQTRLGSAQAESTKRARVAKDAEHNVAVKRLTEEAEGKLRAIDMKANLAAEKVAEIVKKSESTDADMKAGEKVINDAALVLKQAERYSEMQAKSARDGAKEANAKIAPRLNAFKAKLDALSQQLQDHADKVSIAAVVNEVDEKIKEVDDALKQAVAMEAPFKGKSSPSGADAAAAVADLDKAIQSAASLERAAKTFVAMKRVSIKRVAEKIRNAVNVDLDKAQARLETMGKKIGEMKRNAGERKISVIKQDIASSTETMLAKCAVATKASKAFSDAKNLTRDEMVELCEKATRAQKEAAETIAFARSAILSRQREAKTLADVALQVETSKALEKATKLNSELEAEKAAQRDQEQKYTSERLKKTASELVTELEKQLAGATEAVVRGGDGKNDLAATVILLRILSALKEHMKSKSMAVKDIFRELAGGKAKITEASFVAFLSNLSELEGPMDEDLLKRAFASLGVNSGEDVSEDTFSGKFKEHYICTSAVTMNDGLPLASKTLRRVNTSEVFEALADPTKDESSGLFRVKVRSERDHMVGYVTAAGNQGTRYLEPYTSQNRAQKEVEGVVADMLAAIAQANKKLEQNMTELRVLRGSALTETKAELMKSKALVAKVQAASSQLKKKADDAIKKQDACLDAEKKRIQDAVDKREAAATINEYTSAAATIKAAADEAVSVAQALLAKSVSECTLKDLEEAEKGIQAATESANDLSTKLKSKQDEVLKGGAKSPLFELKQTAARLKAQVAASMSSCGRQATALKGMRKQIVDAAHGAIVTVLRAHGQKKGLRVDSLFKELGGEDALSVAKLKTFIESIPGSNFKAADLDLGLSRYGGGVTKTGLSELFQEHLRCCKEIAVTNEFDIKVSKVLRKLGIGELIEVLEAEVKEKATGVPRLRCRALCDGLEGWVTTRGNQGTAYLEACPKPYYCLNADVGIEADVASGSTSIQHLKKGEVVEVLEGPRQEPPLEILRLRGKAQKDGKLGWVTVSDAQGTILELQKGVVCSQSIALTTAFDITGGGVVRKVEAGEVLEPLEEERVDDARQITRVRVKAAKDGKEGWITVRGNQGTSYIAPSEKFYVCRRAATLELRLASGSGQVRQLVVGEAFEALEAPKIETRMGGMRVKCRSISDDSKDGWFTLSAASAKPWQSVRN